MKAETPVIAGGRSWEGFPVANGGNGVGQDISGKKRAQEQCGGCGQLFADHTFWMGKELHKILRSEHLPSIFMEE